MQPGLAAPASVPLAPFTHGLLLVAPAAAEHWFAFVQFALPGVHVSQFQPTKHPSHWHTYPRGSAVKPVERWHVPPFWHSFVDADAHGSGGGESTGEKPHTHRTRHRAMCRLAAEPSSQLSSHLILSVTRGTPLPLTDQDCCAV